MSASMHTSAPAISLSADFGSSSDVPANSGVAQARATGVTGSKNVENIDGRHRKRAENVDRVRRAILDSLSNGVTPTLPHVARAAGVTTRSVYRYFGDIDAAVNDAIAVQRERVFSAFRGEPAISPTSPLDERVAMLALRRLRLEELITPVAVHLRMTDLDGLLDAEVDAAFIGECGRAGRSSPIDEELAALLRGVFALPSIAALRQAFGDDPNGVVRGIGRIVSAVIGPAI